MSDIEAGYGDEAVPPPPRPIEYSHADASGWWLSILGGVALIVLGLWLLTNLFESVVVLAWLVGISLIVAGIVEVMALHGEGLGFGVWLAGALLVAAGIAVMVWPDITLWAIAVLAGAALVFDGALRLVLALSRRDREDMPFQLGLAGLTIALGVMVLVWPEATIVVLAVLLGLRAIGTGLVAIGVGWQLRRLAS